MPQRRNYYRINFPLGERPRLSVGGAEYDVLELSEGGARIGPADASPSWQGAVSGVLTLRDGTEAAVTAVVLRHEEDSTTVQFTENLPLPLIIGEQRRLLSLFPREALLERAHEDQARDAP